MDFNLKKQGLPAKFGTLQTTGKLSVVHLHAGKGAVKWTIERAANAFSSNLKLYSQEFNCFGCKWYLIAEWRSPSLDLKLIKKSGPRSPHPVFLISYLGYKSFSATRYMSANSNEKLSRFEKYSSEYVVATLFENNSLGPNYFYLEDSLTFGLELELFGNSSGNVGDTTAATSCNTKATDILVNDFGCLLRKQTNCDLTLEVGSEKFRAHKLILGARSKVFAAMLKHDTKESRSSVVTIKDMEPVVMSELLRYIYTGNVSEMSEKNATGLYVAADKYALLELKSQCADFLVRNLSVGNAVDVAVLADLHNDGMIIDSVKRFALKNASLLSTEKWNRLVQQDGRLAYEITRAFVPQQ